MRRDPCIFEEAVCSLESDEWKILYGNATRIVLGFRAGFLEAKGVISTGMVAGSNATAATDDALPDAGRDYVRDAIKWFYQHPKEPQEWELRDLSNLICWKARHLIRDAYRKHVRARHRQEREIERERARQLIRQTGKLFYRARRLFEPGGEESFRQFLLRGGKGDLDALVFFDYVRSHDDAARPTKKKGKTFNIGLITVRLREQTGTLWTEHRTQNARRRMLKRLDEFEGEE